jgi:NADP-dependent 3-hydroxy acid dehydrogenase YdfG
MPSISVRALGLADPPPFDRQIVATHYNGEALDLFVINAGMESGEPSVMFVAQGAEGMIVIETSLLALLAGARAAQGMAETQFGWTMPP